MHYLYPRMRNISDITSIGTSILQGLLVHDKHEFTDLMALMHANPAKISFFFFFLHKANLPQNMSNERKNELPAIFSLIVQYCT